MPAHRVAATDLLPKWTKRAVPELSGRDPLGLSRVAQMLADGLLPGIITQTDRARYYALYCWILWHIAREDEPGDWPTFVASFQRREAAVALATLIVDPDSSPVGKIAVKKRLRESQLRGDVNTAFRVLPASTLGGFSQYYGGCLHQLGLTFRSADGLDRAATGIAEHLAAAVEQSLQGTPYLKRRLFSEKVVDLKALKRSAASLSIDAIALPEAASERKLLVDLFFGFAKEAQGDTHRARRESLARILATLQAYEASGLAVFEKALDDQLLYAPTYFGVLVDEKGRTKQIKTPKGLDWCTQMWRQYCLHQYLTQAIEGFLDALLRLLSAHPEGLPIDKAIASLTGFEFQTYLKTATGTNVRTPASLLKAVGIASALDESTCLRQRDRYGWASPLGESVCEREAARPGQIAARSCLTLVALYGKWRAVSSDTTYREVRVRSGPELSAPTFLPQLDTWLEHGLTWADALRAVVIEITRRHDRVMYEKGRLESCWLHQQDDRLVRDQDYEPYFRASRHAQAVQILADLGLVQWTGPGKRRRLRMASAGRSVLARALPRE